MPARIVRGADIPYLARPHQGVQCFKSLIERRSAVPFMKLIKIYPIRAKTPQALFAFPDQMVTRNPAVVRSRANDHPGLSRDQQIISTAFQSFAEDFLRHALGVNVGCVEKIDAGFQAEIDLPTRTLDIGRSYLTEYG